MAADFIHGSPAKGGMMADFVKYRLDDGSEVFFESAEASLVSLRGGSADVVDAGKLGDRLSHIAAAAEEVSKSLRERLAPEEIELEFGVKVSGEVGWFGLGHSVVVLDEVTLAFGSSRGLLVVRWE